MIHVRRGMRVTLDELEQLGIELADANAEDDRAYRRARRKLWRTFRREVERRAQLLARSVNRRKAGG